MSSKRAKLGDGGGEAPLPPTEMISDALARGKAGIEEETSERKTRLRMELERLVAEIEQLEGRIDKVLTSSSSDDSDSTDSDVSRDDDGESVDTISILDELEADLRRAQAHRSLIEQKLRGLELEAKHASKLRAAERRQAAIDARSADLLKRVRAGLAAGGEDVDTLPRDGAKARSLRRQM